MAQGDDLNGILFEPGSDWVPPTEFPSLELLRSYRRIGFDSEVRDPNLKAKGPGSIRKDGYPVGFSLAGINPVDGLSRSWYFPIRHLSGGNLPMEGVVNFLRDALGDPHTEKVGANVPYDLEWARNQGITVRGRLHDVQAAEALIDEESDEGYSLEVLSRRYLGIGKDEQALRTAATAYGINAKSDMWKLHSRYVGPYAETDALNPLRILKEQEKELHVQGLGHVYDMECELMPIVHEMRQRGVRVDIEAAEALYAKWSGEKDQISYRILVDYHVHLDPWSAKDIAKVCDRLNVPYPRTEKGNPSFEQDFIERSGHPFLRQLRQLRRYDSLGSRFVRGMVLDNAIHGRIHCQFHQLKGDENGVRGGRFSSTGPNLQQVPARDAELAPLIRGLFIPEEGCQWAKLDYSQQEPRIAVHYAVLCKLVGADVAAAVWRANPSADFYAYIAEVAEVVRKDAKTIFLGRSYGMGKRKLADDLGRSEEEAALILEKFDARNPYVKRLADLCMRQVERKGYIKTLGGRICHFDHWIPTDSQWGSGELPIHGREKAESHYPNRQLKRAFTHKSLNRLIQGSAGDMTKLAIIKNFKEHGAIPHLTVHDELDYSCTTESEARALQTGMEQAVQLKVPIVAELDFGKSWK